MRGQPRDERDWAVRGLERQGRAPERALEDYDRALEVNPRYRTALQNKAHVLGERLGRTADALAALDALLAYYPSYVPARAGRGVLHARLGHREAAHADAVEALENDKTPYNTYQVAGIYALTSRQVPDDRREALRLLEIALNQGFGLELIDRDHDLDAIRGLAEFRELVRARARNAPARSVTHPTASLKNHGAPRADPGGLEFFHPSERDRAAREESARQTRRSTPERDTFL